MKEYIEVMKKMKKKPQFNFFHRLSLFLDKAKRRSENYGNGREGRYRWERIA